MQLKHERKAARDMMKGLYLGPAYSQQEIESRLTKCEARFEGLDDDTLIATCAEDLAQAKALAWMQGPMEFGPRALGNRSILGDPRSPTMQKTLNLKVKYRETSRPFAPSVLGERVSEWFDMDAVTHVDYSARIQTVRQDTNLRYYALLSAFERKTGVARP